MIRIGRSLKSVLAGFVILLGLAVHGGASLAEQAIRIGVTEDPNTLDPARTNNGVGHNVAYMIYSGLTYYGPDLSVKPDLAVSWESSDDLKQWTFHLRQDVRFQDGREFSADDVVATVERLSDKAVGSVLRVNFDIIDKTEVIDKHTLRFTLKIPYAPFPALFAQYQAKIINKGNVDKLATNPIGTGPFKFVEYLPGDRVVLAKNPDYYLSDEPKLDKVVLRIVPDYTALSVALKSGDLDLVWDLPPEQIDAIRGNADVAIQEVPTGTWWSITLDNSTPPFNDVRVRQAFAKLVDKTQFTDIATFGHGSPTHSPVPPTSAYFAKDMPFPEADYEGAKKLLAEAGIDPAGLKLTMWSPANFTQLTRLSIALRDSAQKIGITIDVQEVPPDKFFDEIEGKVPLATDIFFNRVVPDLMTYSWFHSTGTWNNQLWHFSDPEVDKVLDEARRVSDPEQQKQLYIRLQQLIDEKVPGIIVFNSNHADGVSKKIQNFEISPTVLLDLRRVTLAN